MKPTSLRDFWSNHAFRDSSTCFMYHSISTNQARHTGRNPTLSMTFFPNPPADRSLIQKKHPKVRLLDYCNPQYIGQ